MPEHHNISIGFEGGSSSRGDPLLLRNRRKLGLPAINGDILPRDTTTGLSPTSEWECIGCFSSKPTFQVGNGEEEAMVYPRSGAVAPLLTPLSFRGPSWNLQDDSGDNFGTLTLSDFEIWKEDGQCIKIVDEHLCEPLIYCKYGMIMYFSLLANTGTAGNLLLSIPAEPADPWSGDIPAWARPVTPGPTFRPSTGMWMYHYELETSYRVFCADKRIIKIDENSKLRTEGLSIKKPGMFGTKPVTIKLTCSECPKEVV